MTDAKIVDAANHEEGLEPVNKFDPLNWPAWLRWAVCLNALIFLFNGTFMSNVASMIPEFVSQDHLTTVQASHVQTYPVVGYGVGNLFWVPLSKFTGKRYAILISATIFFACQIWSGASNNYGVLISSRVVAGFCGSSIEAIGPAILADLFLERQYATVGSLYGILAAAGSAFGTLLGGYIATGAGWRWFFWLCTIMSGINMVTLWFFFPETAYTRNISGTATGQELEEEHTQENSSKAANVYIDPRATSGKHWFWSNIFFIWAHPHRKPIPNVFLECVRPILFLAEPAVLICSLAFGVTLSAVIIVGTLTALYLPKPPYSFKPENIGLFAIPAIIGILLGGFIGGKLTDKYSSYKRLKRGSHKPEDRLIPLILFGIAGPLGLILFCVFADHGIHWISLAIWDVLIWMPLSGTAAIIISYCSDSFVSYVAVVQVMINAGKNLVGFGIAVTAVDWFTDQGLIAASTQLAGIYWFIYLFFIPLYIFGAKMRTNFKWLL